MIKAYNIKLKEAGVYSCVWPDHYLIIHPDGYYLIWDRPDIVPFSSKLELLREDLKTIENQLINTISYILNHLTEVGKEFPPAQLITHKEKDIRKLLSQLLKEEV